MMRRLAGLVFLCGATLAQAEHVRVTNPNAVSVEAFGRGLFYTFNFDRVVNDDLVAGVGFGTTTTRTPEDADPGVSTALIPVYASYYFMRDQGSLYVTGGASVVANSGGVAGLKSTFGGVEFDSKAVLPTFGVGYENRSDPGFLFRVAAYGIVARKLNPWFGLSLGYAF